MEPFHLSSLDFSLAKPEDLTAEELCLCTFHPKASDSFLGGLYKHWNRRRELLRLSGAALSSGGIAGLSIDFSLEDLNALSSEEMAIVAAGFHLDVDESDKECIKAQKLFIKRRERDLAKGKGAAIIEAVVNPPPPIAVIPTPVIPPPAAAQIPIPAGNDPLPVTLFQSIHTLRLSKLPKNHIQEIEDLKRELSKLCPNIVPISAKFGADAEDELSRVAYVAYADFDSRTVAHQSIIGFKIERWDITVDILDHSEVASAEWIWQDFEDPRFVRKLMDELFWKSQPKMKEKTKELAEEEEVIVVERAVEGRVDPVIPNPPVSNPPVPNPKRVTSVIRPAVTPALLPVNPTPVVPAPLPTRAIPASNPNPNDRLSKTEVDSFYQLSISFKYLPKAIQDSASSRAGFIANLIPNLVVALKAGPDREDYITYLVFKSAADKEFARQILTRYHWGNYTFSPRFKEYLVGYGFLDWREEDRTTAIIGKMPSRTVAEDISRNREIGQKKEILTAPKPIPTLPAPIPFVPAQNIIPIASTSGPKNYGTNGIAGGNYSNPIPIRNPIPQSNPHLIRNQRPLVNDRYAAAPPPYSVNAPSRTNEIFNNRIAAPAPISIPRQDTFDNFDNTRDGDGKLLPKDWIRAWSTRQTGFYYWNDLLSRSEWTSPNGLPGARVVEPIQPIRVNQGVEERRRESLAESGRRLAAEKRALEMKKLEEELEIQQRKNEEKRLLEERLETQRMEDARVEFEMNEERERNEALLLAQREEDEREAKRLEVLNSRMGKSEFAIERERLMEIARSRNEGAATVIAGNQLAAKKRLRDVQLEERTRELERDKIRRIAWEEEQGIAFEEEEQQEQQEEEQQVADSLLPNRTRVIEINSRIHFSPAPEFLSPPPLGPKITNTTRAAKVNHNGQGPLNSGNNLLERISQPGEKKALDSNSSKEKVPLPLVERMKAPVPTPVKLQLGNGNGNGRGRARGRGRGGNIGTSNRGGTNGDLNGGRGGYKRRGGDFEAEGKKKGRANSLSDRIN